MRSAFDMRGFLTRRGRADAGFVAAMRAGSQARLSVLADDLGAHYDASRPSRLELLIEQSGASGLGTSAESQELLARVVSMRATRYNDAPLQLAADLREPRRMRRVLVADQTASAPEVRYGQVDKTCFRNMLDTAISENPSAEVWVLPPEDANARACLAGARLPIDVRRIEAGLNPYALLEQVDIVYTVSAQIGFEALLAGVPVRVFGTPFYAGWGLTADEQRIARRTARPTVAALFEAAYIRYPRYLNPATHQVGTLSDVLDWIELQHAVRQRQSRLGPVVGVGFSLWKRPYTRPFLEAGGHPVQWRRAGQPIPLGASVALWGASPQPAGLPPETRVVRMEDGFIHSSGLGSDLVAPRAQVLDTQGLYFDARGRNDFTDLLNHAPFPTALLERAARLRASLCDAGITKYNLGRRAPAWRAPSGRCVVLVPGQVADDASLRFGSPHVHALDELLRIVRRDQPDAYIVYKPHPDVLSGNRSGLVQARALCDMLDTTSDIVSLIDAADEVHTLSSLAGFDALLRGKRVVTHGMPFYAGWGLTVDAAAPIPWRERKATLDELVAAALILYPLYWDWKLGLFTTPEAVIAQLAADARRGLKPVDRHRTRALMKLMRWSRNVSGIGQLA